VPGPPVSALSLRGCHASCHKGADRPRFPTAPTPRQPTTASPCALLTAVVRSRAPLSATDRTCLSAPRHRRRLAAPAASTLVTAELRVPERRPRLAVHAAATAVYPVWTPPLPTPPGKLWCHRLRRAAVPSARRRPCASEAPSCPSPCRLPCASDVTVVEHICRAARRTGPSWARPWAARTLRRPRRSWARLGRAPTVQAGHADTVQLGRGGFGPVTAYLIFYFLNIFKFLKIQKFV
jgi:hypothetical protein